MSLCAEESLLDILPLSFADSHCHHERGHSRSDSENRDKRNDRDDGLLAPSRRYRVATRSSKSHERRWALSAS